MKIDLYFKLIKNFFISENDIFVNLNKKLRLKKIILNSNILDDHYIVVFPELFIKNYISFYQVVSNYRHEYDTNLSTLSALTLQNYMKLDNLKNDFSLEKLLKDISIVKIDSLEVLRDINNSKLIHLFIENISLQVFEYIETLDCKKNIIINISNADMLYYFIEKKKKSNMKIMLEFNVLNITSINNKLSFNTSSVEGFGNIEIIECMEILKQNNCLYLLKGINLNFSIIQKNIYNFKNAITQISKLVEYIHEHYKIDIEIIYLKNIIFIESSDQPSPKENISNVLYIISEILSFKKNQKVLFDIDDLIFDNTSIYVSSLEKRQVIKSLVQKDESKIHKLSDELRFYSDSNSIGELLENIKNINQLYNLGYITLKTLNMLELYSIRKLEKIYTNQDSVKYFQSKYFINSIVTVGLKKALVFSINTEEALYLQNINIFEKFNFNKHIEIKAYINDLEKQTIVQFLDRSTKNTLKINNYAYQSEKNVLIDINGHD